MSYQQQNMSIDNPYSAGRASTGPASYGQPAAQTHQQTSDVMANLVGSMANAQLGVPGSVIHGVHGGIGFVGADGQYYPTGPYMPHQLTHGHLVDQSYGQYSSMHMHQGPYGNYLSGFGMIPTYGTGRPVAQYYQDHRQEQSYVHREVPGLENRRGSHSTTNDSAPGTPYYGPHGGREQSHVAIIDRSPAYSTPSPHSSIPPHIIKSLAYNKPGTISHVELDALLVQQPAIPQAVPAVFTLPTNMRTLDQSLSNPIQGNRNVYIRGLHPDTDDETLAAYAARFGKVETSKAIIDSDTGACKGFGFAKYVDVRDSENCIRGFYKLGYEVGFARESFNARLKAEGDEQSTNLYVSNLPKTMTEAELGAIFIDAKVSSSRILRDGQGNSRGVGFARFENRDVCEEVIKKYHGQPIGDEGLLLQVRYADTPAQKDLKRITTERRQFRTAEYNVSAYGASAEMLASVSPAPSPIMPNRMAMFGTQVPLGRYHSRGPWKRDISGVSGGSFAASGLPFKDVDRTRGSATEGPAYHYNKTRSSATPTVSSDGSSNDEVTILATSPTNVAIAAKVEKA